MELLQLLTVAVVAAIFLSERAASNAGTGRVHLCFRWTSPSPVPRNNTPWYDLRSACLGGDDALLSTGIRLSYNATSTTSAAGVGVVDYEHYVGSVEVEYNGTAPLLKYWSNSSELRILTRVEYLFVQSEHGGGKCHCLQVSFRKCNVTPANGGRR